jgi:hypothetical protein
MLSWLFGLVLGLFLVTGLSQTAFAQNPPGSTCENPLVVDPVGTPLVNFAINSQAYGNDYTSAMIVPTSSYLNGYDIVFQFTLTQTSFINASISGSWTGLIFVATCPNLATPAPRLAFGGGTNGATVPQFSLDAGTYFMIAGTFPAPDFTDMVINFSATVVQEQPLLTITPNPLDMGMAVPGLDVGTKKLTLANLGLGDAIVSQSGISFSGANADDFSFSFPETTVKSLNPITTLMDKTQASGALPLIIDNAGNNRGAAFNGTHVFVASRQNGNHVYYWDVNNPTADPLELDLTGVAGGTFALSDLNVVGNNIFVSNMVFVGGVFKVYHWNGVAAQPTVLLEFTSDARLGDAFTVLGDPATNALLVASGHATKNFYVWEIVNGAIPNTTPTIYTLNDIEINANFGRLTKVPNENMFVASGSGMGLLLLDSQMNVLAQVPKAWFPWWAMYSQVFYSCGQRYLAYQHVKSSPNENKLYVLDINEGATLAEALQILAASTFADKLVHTLDLGTIANGNASVGFDLVDDMFMAYSAGNGFAVQHFTNVEPLVIPFGTSKTINVHFDPAVPGASTADMTINYNSTSSPATVSLAGTGYLPYTAFSQNFDEVTPIPAGWMPGGWSGIVESTAPLAVVDVRNVGGPPSLPNHVRLFNSISNASVLTLVSPAAVNLADSWVRFSAKMSSASHTGNVHVGYLTNRTDPSTFVSVGTVPVTGTYTQYNVSFLGSGLTFPETAYIGFRFTHETTSRTLYIDDIFYEAVPTLPVFTANKDEVNFGTSVFIHETAANTLQISNTGAGTLTINEADVTITGADAAAFSIIYPGTHTWPIALTTGQTFTFQLRFTPTEARAYTASLDIQDNIAAKAVNSIPLLGSGYDATLQPGFMFDFVGTFPPLDWRRFKGLFGTDPVLPTTEAIWVHDQFGNNPDIVDPNSAKINLYGTSRRHWLMSPPIDLGDGSTDYQLEFDLALTFWNATTPVTLAPEQKFAVVISTDGGLTWSMDNVLQWWNETTPISNTGDHIVIDLSAYSGRVMLGFYGEMTVSTAGTIDYDLFVRNVAVNLPPADPLLFAENFDYPLGSLLTDNGWTAHSGAGTNPVDVTNGLDFAGYIGSGIGGAANLDNTGEDVHQLFEPQTTGNVYAALVVKTEPTNAAGYFFHYTLNPINTIFFTRVWVNATGDGVGIGTSAPATYVPITPGVPTLLVTKLNLETKESSLYVFNSFPDAEPAVADAVFTETSTALVHVGGVALRQYTAAEKVVVDGIRVATTWADAVKAGEVIPPPVIAVTPESLSESLEVGDLSTQMITVSNTGSSALEFELTVSTGSTKSAEVSVVVPDFELPSGGDRTNPQVSSVIATKEVLSSGAAMRSSYSEGFDDITTLPAAGWALINNSAPVGTTSWFQASATAPFPAHSGAATSYIGANYNSTAGAGTISTWLLTPETTFDNGHTISFWTRVPAASSWPDRLEVRLSTSGASQNVGASATEVGDFTTVLLSVNSDLTVGGYPEEWTQFTATISDLAAPVSGRIAFRYFVTDGGPSGNNSNYIGIDSFEYTGGGVTPPDSWLTAAPLLGTLAAGETMDITVGFSASDLTAGSYQGSLVFTSNDPVNPTVTVPVNLTVTDPVVSDFPAPRNLTVTDAVFAAQLSWQAPDLGGGTTEDFIEDFESGTLPTGWVTYDVDGDNYNWENTAVNYSVFEAHTGLYCMTSASYINNVGALTPNNWLVTPAIAVTANSELSFWVSAQDPAWSQEQYYVKVSTTGNAVADFTNTVHSAISPAAWAEVIVDLSAFAGQTIYIAFQHANVTDMFFIKIDDVTVSNTVTKAAYTAPVAAGQSNEIFFRTSGMSQSEIDAKLNPQMTYVYGEAAETTEIGGEAQIIPSGVKHMSGSRSRTLLYDNGPFINSPGTGPNGTDQSILQNTTLGMNTLGAGIQFTAGNRMADDIVVDQTWTVETITVYAYQTGSPTTSTMTGGYVQVWDGDPAAGGQVIWGDVVTNRMASTAWTNSYRLSEGTPGTTRPVMSIVMATPGLVLEPGTYWIDYTLAGSLASGPWAPPITINGQAVTGNAKQFLGTGQNWVEFLDTGTGTPAQGLPFLIEGTAGGGGGGDFNLTGYNIYRDGTLIATNPTTQRNYLDAPLTPGTYTYGVTAVYDQPSVGESDPIEATVTISNVVDINMQNGTITICEGNFYDSGGATGQYQNDENLTLTFLPATAGAKMKFNFVEYNTEANYDYLKVFDGPNTSSPQIGPAEGFNGVGVPALLAELVATNAEGAITFQFTSDGSVQRDGWKALISCFTPADVDLEAKSVSGNITPSVGTATTYNVEVKNLGSTTQSTYMVKLMQAGGVELNSVAGPTIEAGQTLMVPLSWTPTAQGPTSIYGVVEVAGDGNPQNNTSPSLNVTVQPEGVVAITVGVGNVLPTFRIPFDFYWKNSLSQTIYYPEELENIGGALLGLNYYNSFTTNLPGKAVKIWVGTTDMADLSQGWADPSGFTLVYDGTVDFPSGSNVIYIPFSEPYIYGGGNLVIYTNRVWEDVYFASSDLFYATETANKPNRTRHVQLDATVFDPLNPPAPADAQLKSWHPNTTLFFNTSGLGALQGVVSSSGQPVEGVKIQVEGTSVMTHTNAQGQYNFPYLLPGNINVTASKFGYVAQTLPTTIVVDQTATLNFSLQAMPTVTVSGFVAGSDAPTVGIEGAQVSLEGYENYQATTNASGMFSIPGVYANNTYAVEVSASGYADYSGTAVVGSTNLVLPNIILQEVMAPPANLTANISATNPNLVQLAWNMQQNVEFRYDDGVRLAQLGSTSGTLNTVLGSKHTSSAVLSEMSWLLSDDATGGGPHATIKIYVFGLTGAGIPDGNNVLYSATVSNTDGVWNTHTFPTPVTASGGFFLGVAYAGFVGLGTDDGVGDPYVFQPNTHYFVGDYTAGGWETWETYNFLVNGMIRGMGVPGGKASYAVNETSAPQVTTANSGTLELTKLAQPVAAGEPNWSAQGDQTRSLLGFNVYKNGEVMAAMVQEMTYSYTEMQMGVHCYHITAMYGSGESAPSNQACVDILVGVNELADATTSIYPNPAKNSLNIESLPMSRITVINALGQTVLDMELNRQNSLVLNVEGWDAGVYMLHILTSEGTVTKRATIVK